jgi:hypothetical protein
VSARTPEQVRALYALFDLKTVTEHLHLSGMKLPKRAAALKRMRDQIRLIARDDLKPLMSEQDWESYGY